MTPTQNNDTSQVTIGEVVNTSDRSNERSESETGREGSEPAVNTAFDNEVMNDIRDDTHIDPGNHPEKDLDQVLSFTVSSKWGHFRRVDGNSVSATYNIPPRTTIIGLLSAVLGLQPNSYYEVFSPDNSRVAVEPVTPPRTISMPYLIMQTSSDEIESNPKHGKVRAKIPEPEKPRHIQNSEVLVDPAYRIDVGVSTKPVYNALKAALEEKKAYYTPSLGKSEFIASLDFHGESEVEPAEEDVISTKTAAPVETGDVVPDPDSRPRTEKVPMHMEQTDDPGYTSRRTKSFGHVTYSANGEPLNIQTDTVQAHTVDDRVVTFI